MKFEEVLPAFREGKRIKRTSVNGWFKQGPSDGVDINIKHLLADDWEVEKKPTIKAERVFNNHLARFDVELLNFFHDTLDGVMKSESIKVTIEEIQD